MMNVREVEAEQKEPTASLDPVTHEHYVLAGELDVPPEGQHQHPAISQIIHLRCDAGVEFKRVVLENSPRGCPEAVPFALAVRDIEGDGRVSPRLLGLVDRRRDGLGQRLRPIPRATAN